MITSAYASVTRLRPGISTHGRIGFVITHGQSVGRGFLAAFVNVSPTFVGLDKHYGREFASTDEESLFRPADDRCRPWILEAFVEVDRPVDRADKKITVEEYEGIQRFYREKCKAAAPYTE